MQTSTIQAIIFDFGGVLLQWNPRFLYRRFFDDPQDMEEFLAEINFGHWNEQQDRGRSFADGVAELSGRFPHYAHLIRAYHEHWEESVPGPIAGTVEILRELKAAGYVTYGLSNWSAETFPLARRKYDFFSLLDGYIISGEVGLVKPDVAMFRLLTERIGAPASACLFIDDWPGNVEAAKQLGFATILFRSPEQLRRDLVGMGILGDEETHPGTPGEH